MKASEQCSFMLLLKQNLKLPRFILAMLFLTNLLYRDIPKLPWFASYNALQCLLSLWPSHYPLGSCAIDNLAPCCSLVLSQGWSAELSVELALCCKEDVWQGRPMFPLDQ